MKKIVFILATLTFSLSALASVVTIEGKSATKEKAIEDTLQRALIAYVAERVTKPSADANYAKLQPAIYAPYKDFIAKYEIVSEREDGQLHYINARVEIDDAKVNGQLTALGVQPGVGGKPRVAVLASEQNVDGSWAHSFYDSIFNGSGGNVAAGEANFNICEGVVTNALIGGGFPVIDMTIDPTEVKKAYKYKPVFERYDENMFNIPNENAAKLAKAVDNEVEVVVTCSALAKSQGKKSAYMNSVIANVSCKAVNVKGNTRVANAIASVAMPHIDTITGGNQAIEKACKDVGDKLVTALSDRYK